MAAWNSVNLEVLYTIFGWVAFVSWSISFYPQVFLNFRRKSVVGLNFDFVVLLCSLVVPFRSSIVESMVVMSFPIRRLWRKRGERESKGTKTSMIQETGVVKDSKADLRAYQRQATDVGSLEVSEISHDQRIRTEPYVLSEAVMNFRRKSTIGFSIGNILLDLLGGLTNYGQMAVQSIDQSSWVNFYGNIGKTLLSLVSIFFDILFILQHYVLYPEKKSAKSPTADVVSKDPLIESYEIPRTENV